MKQPTQETERELLRATSPGTLALAFAAVLVLGAALVFVWSGVTTASGRIAATTTNDSSLISAVSIDLAVESSAETASTGLLLDAAGLYPGLVVERCFGVTYWGNPSDVPIRLTGRPEGGSGLEAFIETVVELGVGNDPACSDFGANETIFSGRLLELWNRHGSFETGLPLIDSADSGATTWVRISVEVVDDNNAQDLTTAFWLIMEARP